MSGWSRRRASGLISAVGIVVMVLGSCTPAREQISPTAGPVVSHPPVDDVYSQQITWSGCATYECATIQVPLDWSVPGGQTVQLALARHAAADPSARLGAVLINPGGPGVSGIDFLEYFVSIAGARLVDHYDIVAFDPRGVGSSTPVWCGSDAVLDEYFMGDVVLLTEDDIERERQRIADFAAACRETSGPIVENIDTVSAARDMDVIRAALGESHLNMLGFSYGTELALAYAETHPSLVGRIVLDGAVDPLLEGEDLSLGQAEGFEDSLTAFLEWCMVRSTCDLGPTVAAARAEVQAMLAHARETGYPTLTGDRVNGQRMIHGIVVTLYSEESWHFLELALNEVKNDATADMISVLADFYFDRDSATGRWNSNFMVAFTAIGCLGRTPDDDEDSAWNLEDLLEFRATAIEASPTFGSWFASGLGCEGWPWYAKEVVTSLDNAATADPMLIIGTSNDPATPLKWAESLADRLDMPLLVWEGEGHTAYGRSNRCVIDAVDSFFVDGVLPDSGQTC